MKLRSHLIILVVAALLPVLIFAGVMIMLYDRQQRAAVESQMIGTARALSLAVDREVAAWTSTLEALGSSGHLDSGNLSVFREEALRVLKTRKDWNNILLTDSESRQLLNLFLPLGSPLPPVKGLEQFQQVIKSSQPVASDLFLGRVSRTHVIGVAVPIVRDGKVRYVLASSTLPDSLLRILAEQDIPADWIGTIIDRKGIIMARTRNFRQFIGKPAMELSSAQTGGIEEGSVRGTTDDGTEVQVAFHRSELTGWTVRLAIPVSALEAPLRRSLWMTVVGGLLLLIGAVVLAILFGRRITKPIVYLSRMAEALREGKAPQPMSSSVVEVSHVAEAIAHAGQTRNQIDEALRALRDIELAISSSLDLSTVLHLLVEKAETSLPPGSVITVRLRDAVTGEFDPAACRNIDEGKWKTNERKIGSALTSIILETKAPLIMENVQTDPRRTNRDFARQHGLISCLGLPLLVKGEVLGLLSFYTKEPYQFGKDEVEFLSMLASHAAIAIHNSQLYGRITDLAASLAAANERISNAYTQLEREVAERKRLEREVLEITRKERQRIGQDLHDELGQELTGIAFLTKGLEEKLRRRSEPDSADAEKITRLVNEAIRHARALARGLSPVPVEANGLMSALEELAESVRSVFGISCGFRCEKPVLLADNTTATHLYHIVQEAVDNAVKHGEAKQIIIELSASNSTGLLSVADDGRGLPQTTDGSRGLGLRIMKHRAEMVQGLLEIRPKDGGGTRVLCSFRLSDVLGVTHHDGAAATGI